LAATGKALTASALSNNADLKVSSSSQESPSNEAKSDENSSPSVAEEEIRQTGGLSEKVLSWTPVDKEVETEHNRLALQEEALRIKTRRAEYFDVLVKAASNRLSGEAIQLIANMRTQSISLDTGIYNAAMAACLDQPERFGQLRTEMLHDGVQPNISTLVITTTFCEMHSLFEESYFQQMDILKKIRERNSKLGLLEAKSELDLFNVAPTSAMYYGLIRQEIDQNNIRRAYSYLVDMAEKKVKFSFISVEMVIDLCIESGLQEEAQHLIDLVTEETILNPISIENDAENDENEQSPDFYAEMASMDTLQAQVSEGKLDAN
jgi:hypothetical protein